MPRWLATHYRRPRTPTDQARIESLSGHLKIEQPHLELIEDIDVPRAELERRGGLRRRWLRSPTVAVLAAA